VEKRMTYYRIELPNGALVILKKIIAEYNISDIFNADKMGYFISYFHIAHSLLRQIDAKERENQNNV
jgi:hypothetical protein